MEKSVKQDVQTILARLGQGAWFVTFTKKDGTDRTLRCTRDASLLPAGAVKGTDKRKDQGGLIAVYDLDAETWKGFQAIRLVGMSPVQG